MNGASLRKSIQQVVRQIRENPDMLEEELYGVLDKSGFFEYLGYERFGVDVRKQFVIVGEGKKPDYVCLDEYQNAIFVIEAKKPSYKKLEDALDQLWERYVLPLRAHYGVLINGERLIAYKRSTGGQHEPVADMELESISKSECDSIVSLLRKPEYDITLLPKVREYFETVETLPLNEPLAKEYFLETFKLTVDSVFGASIESFLDLFDWVYPRSKFLKGAYSFWRRSLARKPDKIPNSWKPFLEDDKDVFKFMFCLETAHALLARLILAKACEDMDFPGISISRFSLEKVPQTRNQIPVLGYPIVLIRLLREMRDQLIYSIFEEDIFSWWIDAFKQFGDKSSIELLKEKADAILERSSRAIAKTILVLYKFDFREVAGDPLGDLYQQYFDRETRKALGEFYTPLQVVEYILDAVGYKSMRYKRLIDPACGSGTFLVEALRRYLAEAKSLAKKIGWASVLRELCNSPKIVGLDIHPFACLIAQVRFMLELIPFYKKALEEERLTVFEALQRLPVFRTDSLIFEMAPEEFRKTSTLLISGEDIKLDAALPLQTNGEKSVSFSIVIPSWKKTTLGTEHNLFNLDEYFCVIQGIFDAIKSVARAGGSVIPAKGLEAQLRKYLTNKDFPLLAEFFRSYAENILSEINKLRAAFEDGRLIKSIEDAVLASLLKNYMQYDVVVGNPPYVKTQSFVKSKSYIRRRYKTAHRNFDIYVPFMERGIDWLRKEGRFGFIVSNMFHKRDYGEKPRSYILKNCVIDEFIDFGASGVFEEVTNYPCIIIMTKRRAKNNLIRCVRVAKGQENTIHEIGTHREKRYSDEFMDVFEQEQDSLTSDPWTIMPEEERVVFEKIKCGPRHLLKEICDPTLGIKEATRTGANQIYIVDRSVVKSHLIEEDLLVPKIKGAGEIKRWYISWDGKHIVFPHEKTQNGSFVPVDLDDFPNAKRYLGSHRERLEKRKLFKKTILEHGKNWYELWNPLPFERPKIVYPEISKRNSFAFDEGKFYCVGKNFIVYLSSERREDYLYLLALLNSDVLEFYFKHYASIKRANYFEYMGNVGEIPILSKADSEMKQKVTDIVEEILRKEDSKRLIGRFPSTYISDYKKEAIEFDEIRCKFHADHVELKPILGGHQGEVYAVHPDKNEEPILVETPEKAQYIQFALWGRRVNKGDTLQILIPRENAIVDEILEDFSETCEVIGRTNISVLEKEINDVVLRLYGLDDQDKEVIREFLKKF